MDTIQIQTPIPDRSKFRIVFLDLNTDTNPDANDIISKVTKYAQIRDQIEVWYENKIDIIDIISSRRMGPLTIGPITYLFLMIYESFIKMRYEKKREDLSFDRTSKNPVRLLNVFSYIDQGLNFLLGGVISGFGYKNFSLLNYDLLNFIFGDADNYNYRCYCGNKTISNGDIGKNENDQDTDSICFVLSKFPLEDSPNHDEDGTVSYVVNTGEKKINVNFKRTQNEECHSGEDHSEENYPKEYQSKLNDTITVIKSPNISATSNVNELDTDNTCWSPDINLKYFNRINSTLSISTKMKVKTIEDTNSLIDNSYPLIALIEV